ncbi:MAG TPA: glycosyltransferase family 4 protein [Pengzhenrongella sp.]
MHVVTIAARNYLPFTRLLARSFKEHNPEGTLVVLVVDAEPGEVTPDGDFEIVTAADLPLDDEEFRRLAFIYDVTELSTALKPWALEMLLLRGATTAVYLDPDILVYSSLDEVEALSREHGIVLTPHAIEPIPRDGLRPTEADIMGAGVYNLGFIAVGPRNMPMLHWWQERLRRDSISAPEQMLFTDQRWIDLVPGLWDCAFLHDPGYNVAYWNLDNRPVERRDGVLHAGGSPLRFFHFSGYRPERPWILSKYVADNPRVVLSDHPVVQELCDDYGRRAQAEGMRPGSIAPYRFSTLTDGTPIGKVMRGLYRAAVLRADAGIAPYPPAPFTPAGDAALRGWFTEPGRHGLSRLLLGLWEARDDLRRAFPGVSRGDVAGLLDWAATHGVREREVPKGWLPAKRSGARSTVRATSTPGINLAGYFAAELGMGTGARLLLEATKAAGLPVTTIGSSRTESRQQANFEAAESDVRYPINVAFVNADQFPLWADDVGQELLRGRYTIGVWAWEVEEFPDYPESFQLVDEVWGISAFVRDAVKTRTDKPVHVVPLPIPPAPAEIEPLDRSALGLPDAPYFLFVFDYFSLLERKNPTAVVEAFTRAFAEGEGPYLVIKTINGGKRRADRERLRLVSADRSDILLVEDYLSSAQLTSLMAEATAYVSLHRSEGYGLTMAESMALGRPVIATAYSGNLDFMTEENSLLVPSELVPVGPDAGPYPATTHWADPDVEVAARHMRHLVDDPEFARELGERARASVAEIGDISVAAAFVRERVEAIMADKRGARRRAREVQQSDRREGAGKAARRVMHMLGGSPDRNPPGLVLRVARRARRVVGRLRSRAAAGRAGH